MQDLTSRVTIIAVGISDYHDKHFAQLREAESDIERLRNLLVEDPKTALFHEGQFTEKINPTINELRQLIVDYTLERSSGKDILLFYFSGHGVPVGGDDFGFQHTGLCPLAFSHFQVRIFLVEKYITRFPQLNKPFVPLHVSLTINY